MKNLDTHVYKRRLKLLIFKFSFSSFFSSHLCFQKTLNIQEAPMMAMAPAATSVKEVEFFSSFFFFLPHPTTNIWITSLIFLFSTDIVTHLYMDISQVLTKRNNFNPFIIKVSHKFISVVFFCFLSVIYCILFFLLLLNVSQISNYVDLFIHIYI